MRKMVFHHYRSRIIINKAFVSAKTILLCFYVIYVIYFLLKMGFADFGSQFQLSCILVFILFLFLFLIFLF